MLLAHHCRFRHRRMSYQRTLHFHGADAMSRHVQHIVHAAEDPPVAVFVKFCTIAGEVQIGTAGPFAEVRLDIALSVAPDGAQHAGPRPRDGEQSAAKWNRIRIRVNQCNTVTRQRKRRAGRLGFGHARQR